MENVVVKEKNILSLHNNFIKAKEQKDTQTLYATTLESLKARIKRYP